MLNFRKKLLAVILTASMLVTMSQTVAWSAADDTADDTSSSQDADNTATKDDTSEDNSANDNKDEDEVKLLTDEEGLAQMKQYADNENFTLYVNEETTIFAIKVKADGYVWWSSPLNAEADGIAKKSQIKTMQSPFYFNYGDPVEHRPNKLTAVEGSISKKSFEVKQVENGVRFDYTFKKVGIMIPMQVTLEKDYFTVQILTQEITEEDITSADGSVLLDISLLANFGAAGKNDEGYIVVPDGSGAVINFNNGKQATQTYSGQVYGRDTSVGQLLKPAITEQVYLPITGSVIQNSTGKDHAFLAIADKGDTTATVRASVYGQSTTEYNTTWFDFTLRTQDTFYMGANNRKLTVYQAGNIKTEEIAVRYYPLEADDISYVDLANTYRDYLVNEKGLTNKTEGSTASYYLDLYGGTVKTQSIAGFPVDQETPATTYLQAKEILEKLADKGVDDVIVTYNDFNAAGIVGMISAGVDYSGTLGGKNDFTALSNFINEKNYKLFPSVDLMEFENSGNGYSFTLNAAKQVTKAYATQNNYDLAFGIPNQLTTITWTSLSPYYFPDLFKKVVDSFTKEKITNISLATATSNLYSDFSRGIYTRADSENILKDGYQSVKDSGMTLLGNSANAYALPYVDFLTDIPLYSSNYDLFDYDIPFYEIVIHGLIPYTTKAINASADASDLILLAFATGTPVHYDMMYADPNDFTDSEYDSLFYSNYKGWIDSSAQVFQLFKENISELTTQKIVSHKYLSTNVTETVFENGKTIVVDTANNKVSVDGNTIDLTQYGLKGETNE